MNTGGNRAGAGGDPRHPNRLPPHRAAEAALDFNTAPSPWAGRLRSHHDALEPLRALARPVPGIAPRLRELLPDGRPRTVYIHVPFCTHNCTFCNLNRRWAAPPPDYADLLVQEIKSFSDYPYVTRGVYGAVYFGGGTPTVLAPQDLKRVIRALRGSLDIAPDAEITVETTVSDLTPAHIHALREAGVNRISVGIQTFCDRGRRYLGRWGSGEEAVRKLEELLSAGFRNVGIDLIYNWPGQTLAELTADLETIRSLDLAGVSFYPLILHRGARIMDLLSSGALPPMGDISHEKRLFDLIWEELRGAGFELLELTKLVRPGRDEYRYVAIRYAGGDTLGLGAGAGGKLGDLLYLNPSDPARYRARVEAGAVGPSPWSGALLRMGRPHPGHGTRRGPPPGVMWLIRTLGISSRVPPLYDLAYRLVGAVEFDRFRWGEFPGWVREVLAPELVGLEEMGLVRLTPEGFSLTRDGVFWGHNIARDLARAVIEAEKVGGTPTADPRRHRGGR